MSEIAFLEFAPQFLDCSRVTYVYHRNWPVYENYISGKFDGQAKPNLDFLLLENPYETFKPVSEVAVKNSDEALERVSSSRILRVAYDDYFPAFMSDAQTGAHVGIFADALSKIAERQRWQLKWTEETGYGVIAAGLADDRFDLFGGAVWPTPERKRCALFTRYLYESAVFAWKSGADSRDYSDSRNSPFLRIAIKEGDISHSIATHDFPNARLVRVPQMADPGALLQFVADGKADITFVEPTLAGHFRNATGLVLSRVNELGIIRNYENTFMLGMGQTSLLDILNREIDCLVHDGTISHLIAKYTGDSSTFAKPINGDNNQA